MIEALYKNIDGIYTLFLLHSSTTQLEEKEEENEFTLIDEYRCEDETQLEEKEEDNEFTIIDGYRSQSLMDTDVRMKHN